MTQPFLSDEFEKLANIQEFPYASPSPCERCGKKEVRYKISEGDYADYNLQCFGCGRYWSVDGPDS